MTKRKSFLESLFDFSFSNFITPLVAGFIYALAILIIAISTCILIVHPQYTVMILGSNKLLNISLILVSSLMYLLVVRFGLESLVASIKTAQNTSEIKELLRQIRNDKTI